MDAKYAWFSSVVRAGDDPKSNFKNLGGKLTSNISPREEFSMSQCALDTPAHWRIVLFPLRGAKPSARGRDTKRNRQRNMRDQEVEKRRGRR